MFALALVSDGKALLKYCQVHQFLVGLKLTRNAGLSRVRSGPQILSKPAFRLESSSFENRLQSEEGHNGSSCAGSQSALDMPDLHMHIEFWPGDVLTDITSIITVQQLPDCLLVLWAVTGADTKQIAHKRATLRQPRWSRELAHRFGMRPCFGQW